jgi:alpha-amylase
MKKICLIFLEQPSIPIRPYRFFEIGEHAPYWDGNAVISRLRKEADICFNPINQLLLRQIRSCKDQIRVTVYLSGLTADLLKLNANDGYELFQQLAGTGCVEFLSGTYSWSLSSQFHPTAFRRQMSDHCKCMEQMTGKKRSDVFINSGLFYDNRLGQALTESGMKGVITEGEKQLLGWRTPDKLYSDKQLPAMRIFFRNPGLNDEFLRQLTDDNPQGSISKQMFSPEKLLPSGEDEQLFNLIIPYNLHRQTGGFSSGNLRILDQLFNTVTHSSAIQFHTPSDLLDQGSDIDTIQTEYSMPPEGGNNFLMYEPDNDLQRESVSKLYEMSEKMEKVTDLALWQEWNYLQSSFHTGNMSTRSLNTGPANTKNPFSSPFEAFIHYMNILNDFNLKLDQFARK